MSDSFCANFRLLTGHDPFPWQQRLHAVMCAGRIPRALDLPTGLGKTSVMAIWYLARLAGARLPRRLVYVVDRRAVVDQATEVAEKIRKRAPNVGGNRPAISTLRGQFVDNKRWLENPAKSAIVVGTIDMVGSRLLFSGYGVSRTMRPFHAGLIGADTLLVLDESHLVPPFERLLEQIGNGAFAGPGGLAPPLRLMALSATRRAREDDVFRLDGDDRAHDIVRKRLDAAKTLRFAEPGGKLEDALAGHAWRLTGDGAEARRILVYCSSRDTAGKTRDAIAGMAKGDRKAGVEAVGIDVQLFVGARRVAERQAAAVRLKTHGFLAGSDKPPDKPAFVVATSAGEVGVDLDADHCVMDLAPFERMVQRLGRVNRRGDGAAEVVVVEEAADAGPVKKQSAAAEDLAARAQRCRALLEQLPAIDTDGLNASPQALTDLVGANRVATGEASTPAPLHPALTRPLVDAWSMTSLKEHTGRPEVAPWWRGWVDDRPQTTLVWRSHLPVRQAGSPATIPEIEAFFAAAPPHLAEKLETETFRIRDWLNGCLKRDDKARAKLDADGTTLLPLSGNVAFLLDPANALSATFTRAGLAETAGNKRAWDAFERDLAGKTLVLDARIGGLSEEGLLDGKAEAGVSCADTVGDPPDDAGEGARWWGREDDDRRWKPVAGFRVRLEKVDAATDDAATPGKGENPPAVAAPWRQAHAFVTKRDAEGDEQERLVVETWPGEATDEASRAMSGKAQPLADHQAEVAAGVSATVRDVLEDPGLREALVLAARLHDEGKRAGNWQNAFHVPREGRPYAKSGNRRPPDRALLHGYRHEFGSLLRLDRDPDVDNLPDSARDALRSFGALSADLKDLVRHLVAAHHGHARPVIRTDGCNDAPPSVLAERARDVALRFARLQKRYGPWGLAWLEAILRAADQQASRARDEPDAEADTGEGAIVRETADG